MLWTRKHPQARIELLGMVPMLLSDNDRRPAWEQFNSHYRQSGGWRPLKGFTMLPNGDMQYPEGLPTKLLYETKLGEETIRLYDFGLVAIVQRSGEFEVARMD